MILLHFALSVALFLLTNWIGKHAIDFGYSSTTLFESPTESIAFNFFVRAMSPAVFIVLAAVLFVSLGYPEYRLGLYWVAIYSYIVRAAAIFALNRQSLLSWPRFFLHAASGTALALAAYQYLILPNRSLLPNLDSAGNELWLAILAFLYAVANKVVLPDGPGVRRQNKFIKQHYEAAQTRFGAIISGRVKDQALQLITFSILVYEDYCRPPAIRSIEKMLWFKKERSTGVMQVKSTDVLTDDESVERGIALLSKSWRKHRVPQEEHLISRVRSTIADYNRDENYVANVEEVMEVIAKRVDRKYMKAFERIYVE